MASPNDARVIRCSVARALFDLGEWMIEPTQEQIDAIEAKAWVDAPTVRAALSRVPPSWTMIQASRSGASFRRGNQQVVFTVQRYENPYTHTWDVWLHASTTIRLGPNRWRLPDWKEFKRVKSDFIGDRWAYQVLPDEKHYVNEHPYVLHLYALMDEQGNALPDFTWGLGRI